MFQCIHKTLCLLPFYSCRRLTSNIINYPVNTGNFINYAVRYCGKKVMGQASPISSHSIFTGYCSDRYQVAISSVVTHDTNTPDISKYSKALPKLAIKVGFFDFIHHNPISSPEYLQLFPGHFTNDANG